MKNLNLENLKTYTKENLEKMIQKLNLYQDIKDNFLEYFKNNEDSKKILFIWWNQISWSVSPFMHNYSAFLLDYKLSYFLLDMLIEDLKVCEVLEQIKNREDIVWANVTMPYKVDVYDYLREKEVLDKSAYLAWAVNTIVKENWNLVWYNTDIDGIINPVSNHKLLLNSFYKWYVLWAWWAARAVITAMILLWIKNIKVFNRSEENLVNLKNHFENKKIRKIFDENGFWDYKIETKVYDLEKVSLIFEKQTVLINTLPLWFKENLPKYPINILDTDFKNISLYFDIVYDLNYPETPTVSYLNQNYPNIKICDWIEMVVWQAKKWFEMWTWGKKFNEKNIINILKNR